MIRRLAGVGGGKKKGDPRRRREGGGGGGAAPPVRAPFRRSRDASRFRPLGGPHGPRGPGLSASLPGAGDRGRDRERMTRLLRPRTDGNVGPRPPRPHEPRRVSG